MKFGVVILAAGASRRMGRPKLLLPWKGKSIVENLIEQWNSLGATQVALVVSTDNAELSRELDRLRVPARNRVTNPRPEEGMFSSIRHASRSAKWSKDLTHVVMTLGDQPHLKPATLQRLLEEVSRNEDRIWQPSLGGRAKHPVVLPQAQFEELASTDAETLKEYLLKKQELVSLVELDDEGLGVDLDTPEDYENAVRRFGG